jgi:pilus assembly protein Flp/PilA
VRVTEPLEEPRLIGRVSSAAGSSFRSGEQMKTLYDLLDRYGPSFFREEDGSEVIEYALITAVVGVGLVVALNALTTGTSVTSFMTRLGSCLAARQCA